MKLVTPRGFGSCYDIQFNKAQRGLDITAHQSLPLGRLSRLSRLTFPSGVPLDEEEKSVVLYRGDLGATREIINY